MTGATGPDPAAAPRAHETVLAWVTGELQSGRLHIGDHLPPERSLAETLGVSRSSLREAIRVLEALGTVQSARGSGPRSGTIVTAAPAQAVALALNLQLASDQLRFQDLVEVRLMLETGAARCVDPAHADWTSSEQLLDRMDEPGLGLEEFLRLDAEFHVSISRAASNPLVSTLMDALRFVISEHTLARARGVRDWPGLAGRLRREHRAVFEALRAGDGAGAAVLLEDHIRGYYSETQP